MKIEKCKKEVDIKVLIKLCPGQYEVIRQENIIDDTDNLVVGIYYHKEFKYIICCHRGNNILDYTKFAHSEEQAQKQYIQMIEEIKKDLKE